MWDVAVEAIRARKAVILSTQYMNEEEAQRAVDFLAGAAMVLYGELECVGEGLILITPNMEGITEEPKRKWFI